MTPPLRPVPDPSSETTSSSTSPSTSESTNPSPSTSPSPSSSPREGGSAARGSSAGSSAGSRFPIDPGPAFDDGERPESPGPRVEEPEQVAVVDLWDERRVRQLLTAQGMVLHGLVAVEKASTEWVHTARDLEAIAPPLTAILNRYEPTRAAAAAGDELALVVGVAGYATRSIRERRAAIAALEAQAPQPVTGVAADPGSGPEHDEAYLRQQGELGPDDDFDPPPLKPRR